MLTQMAKKAGSACESREFPKATEVGGRKERKKGKKKTKEEMGIRETLTGQGQSIADRVRVDRAPQMLGEGRKDGPRESLTSRSRPIEVARGHQI